jgi:rRNA processing protein Krr1/Pno1
MREVRSRWYGDHPATVYVWAIARGVDPRDALEFAAFLRACEKIEPKQDDREEGGE